MRGRPASRDLVTQAPRPLLFVGGLVLAAGVVMAYAGAWRTGVAWDETYHVLRTRGFLEHGWYLLSGDLLDGRPAPWEQQAYVYAPVTGLLLHGWALLWGQDQAGTVSTTATAYALRHLVIATLGVLGLAATAGLCRVLLRSWGWGVVGAGVLAAVPIWTGQSMFNIKDVPVATGSTLATLGLVLVLRAAAAPGVTGATGASRVRALAGPVLVAGGAVLTLGTRPGAWPGLAAGVLACLVLAALSPRTGDRPPRRVLAAVALRLLLALGAAYAVLLAVYPAAYGTPWTLLTASAESSSRFGGRTSAWWTAPVLVLGDVPWLVLGAALAATGWGLLRLVDGLRTTRAVHPTTAALALVAVQAYALPAAAVLRESNLYNGLRQLLLVVPALAVLACVGLALLVRWGRTRTATPDDAVADPGTGPDDRLPAVRRGLRPTAWGLVLALACLTLVVPAVAQLRLFPYNYAWGSLPSYAVPEADDSDYWRTSVRELAPRLPRTGWTTCSPSLDADGFSTRYSLESDDDCATDVVGPLAPYADLRAGTRAVAPTQFVAVATGNRPLGSNCTVFARVTRPGPLFGLGRFLGLPAREDMSRAAVCELHLPAYPDPDGIDLGPDGDGGPFQLGGWTAHPSVAGIGVASGSASLGAELPADALARGVQVRLTTDRPLDQGSSRTAYRLQVNGRPVVVRAGGPGGRDLLADVPASTARGWGRGRVVLTLLAPDDGLASDGPAAPGERAMITRVRITAAGTTSDSETGRLAGTRGRAR